MEFLCCSEAGFCDNKSGPKLGRMAAESCNIPAPSRRRETVENLLFFTIDELQGSVPLT